ncbi:MAG: hypothetical protein RLY30_573 [Pseudomonadota bacterium]
MPFNGLSKAFARRWAWPWLALILVAHLLLVWGLDQLTGREAERLLQRPPIMVQLIPSPVVTLQRPAAPSPASPPPPAVLPDPPSAGEPLVNPATRFAADESAANASGSGRDKPVSPAAAPPAPAPRESLPESGTLAIQAFLGEYALGEDPLGVGEIRLSFPRPDRYEIELKARAQGWVSAVVSSEVAFRSEGALTPYGLQPTRYAQVTPFRGATESLFDPEQGARLKPDSPWIYRPAGLQDRLSVVFQLAFLAQTRPEQFGSGQRHVIPMATDREIKPLAFTVGNPDELVLPGGILVNALLVESDPFEFRRQGRIKIWLDPADRFYPVRIQYSEPSGRMLDFIAIRTP